VVICTHVFESTAKFQAKALGLPDARMVVVPHPFSGVDAAEAAKKAEQAFPALLALLSRPNGESAYYPGVNRQKNRP
jgi:orotidine-5'-phosphate decarboxylase